MIEFLTLFLGIVSGPQQVAVLADERVARIELRLDDQMLAVAENPPWRFAVDLGKDLMPRKLEAIAFDIDGQEMARARQLLNVPRPPNEVYLVLQQTEDEVFGDAWITWESSTGSRPRHMTAVLDGEEVPVIDSKRVDLRGLAAGQLHVLEVEIVFSNLTAARAHLAFGGQFMDQASAELTAVPVLLTRGAVKPEVLQGDFSVNSITLDVVAVEKGLAHLVVVRSPGVIEALRTLEGRPSRGTAEGNATALGPVPYRARATASDRQASALPIGERFRVRIILPRAVAARGQQIDIDSFPISPEITSSHGGLYRILTQDIHAGARTSQTRVVDALAVAGLEAAISDRRRAVLLLLAGEWEDHSRYDFASIRTFLQALNVPVVVWKLESGSETVDRWGSAEEIHSFRDLQRAWKALEKSLDRQRVVWLEGIHLPPAVVIAEDAEVESVARSN